MREEVEEAKQVDRTASREEVRRQRIWNYQPLSRHDGTFGGIAIKGRVERQSLPIRSEKDSTSSSKIEEFFNFHQSR